MVSARELPSLRGDQLDELFANVAAGDIPVGKGQGQALMATGTFASRPLLAAVRLLAWHGKEFDDRTHSLRNLVSPFGARAITADVYVDASWHDGNPCIVLDYSKTSRIAGWVRDEIRQIGPGLYLGLVYVRSRRAPIRFSLEFQPGSTSSHVVVDVDRASTPA